MSNLPEPDWGTPADWEAWRRANEERAARHQVMNPVEYDTLTALAKACSLLGQMEEYWMHGTPVHAGSLLAGEARDFLRDVKVMVNKQPAGPAKTDIWTGLRCMIPAPGDYVRTQSLGIVHCVSDAARASVLNAIWQNGEVCTFATEAEWAEQEHNSVMCEACGSKVHHTNECCYHQT